MRWGGASIGQTYSVPIETGTIFFAAAVLSFGSRGDGLSWSRSLRGASLEKEGFPSFSRKTFSPSRIASFAPTGQPVFLLHFLSFEIRQIEFQQGI